MTRYQQLKEQADFYTAEASKHYHNPIKFQIFKYIAKQYDRKALRLTIGEGLR